MAKPEKSYRELKEELDTVLETLQRDDIDVDDALKAYEQGMSLVKELESQLKSAENKVTKLKAKFDA